jgi:two-component system, NtrC family, response regulator AtoC
VNEARILIVDDEPSSVELLGFYLKEKGYAVKCATNGRECLENVVSFRPEILILDIRLPDADGLEILRHLKEGGVAAHVIIVTAFHDMETTIRAMKFGAFEYIPKPIDVDELELAISRALEVSKTRKTERGLVIGPLREFEEGQTIGKTKDIKEIFKTIGLLSGNRINALIEGETGTGKELVARAIHYHGPYKNRPFVAINCSAIVKNLIESELFGHEKGAFTGAVATKKGKFELAGEGTILLDEVGEIPFEVQAKLLRFLQTKEFQRVGGEKTLKSDARVIAATNRDLLKMVKQGDFREDLYYRLSVAKIKVPPLRERKTDIPLIIEYLLAKINRDLHKDIEHVEENALRRMLEYNWPGNVRELENVLTRAAIYTQGSVMLDAAVAPLLDKEELRTVQYGAGDISKRMDLQETEKDRIVRVLDQTHWHYGEACKVLSISRPTLNRRLRRYGVAPKPRNYSN